MAVLISSIIPSVTSSANTHISWHCSKSCSPLRRPVQRSALLLSSRKVVKYRCGTIGMPSKLTSFAYFFAFSRFPLMSPLSGGYCSLVVPALVRSLKFKFLFLTVFLIRKVVCGQPIRIFFCRFSGRTGIHIYLPPSYLSAQKCGYRFCLIAENRLLQTPVHMAF